MKLSGAESSNKFFLFLLVLLPFYLTWTFDHSLWNPDETRDAGMASEMARNGDYVVPKLNGEAFLEKPPLYYWTAALVYKVTGRVTAGTTRLPSALYGILGVLFTFFIGKTLFSERVGLFGASILATSVQYFRMSHFALMDVALAALVAGALYFYLRGSKLGFLFFTVLAFYAKGFLGVVLPGLVVTVHLLSQKKFKEWALTVGIGALVFAALVFPWFYGLWKEGGRRFLEIFFIDNHWKRFTSSSADHTEHFWFFYLLSFPVDFLPWTVLYAGHLRDLFKKPREFFDSPPLRFLLTWLFSLFFFFTISSSKRSIYLLPIFPAVALLSAVWLDKWVGRKPNELKMEKRVYRVFGFLALLMGLSSFFLAPRLDKDKSFVPVCDAVQLNLGGDEVVGYDMSEMERGVFGFYLKRTLLNPTSPEQLQALFDKSPSVPFRLIINRNKIEDVQSILTGRTTLLYEHRPNKRTRSYLVYSVGEGKN
jgi:4-amino-4-deoxy-L-arabinose transferase-like glycosyltransferase